MNAGHVVEGAQSKFDDLVKTDWKSVQLTSMYFKDFFCNN
jgi:hypothetical protein